MVVVEELEVGVSFGARNLLMSACFGFGWITSVVNSKLAAMVRGTLGLSTLALTRMSLNFGGHL